MKILVIGATGFIGGAVVKRLLKESFNVKILVRNKERIKARKEAEINKGDLRDFKSIDNAVKGVDVVINCAAALPHHKLPDKDYWDINVLGVQNIVNACIANKTKKLIHISTVGIYGPTNERLVSEKSKFNPENVYAKSKLEGEKFINNSLFKSSSVIIRPTIAYGPGDIRPVFLRLFKMINKGINISIGKGNNYLHTVYIDNLVDVILKATEKESMLGEDFNVGDIVCPKMKDITREIIRVQNKACVNLVIPTNLALFVGKMTGLERTLKFVSQNRRYRIDKVMKYLKLKSDIGISIGMERTYNWYKQNNLL